MDSFPQKGTDFRRLLTLFPMEKIQSANPEKTSEDFLVKGSWGVIDEPHIIVLSKS